MSRSTWSWSPARARTSSSSPPTSRDSRALMTLSCMSGMGAAVAGAPAPAHVPGVADDALGWSTARPRRGPRGRRSPDGGRSARACRCRAGDRRISSSPASSDARVEVDGGDSGDDHVGHRCESASARSSTGGQFRRCVRSHRRSTLGLVGPPLDGGEPVGRVGVVVGPRRHAVDRGDLDAPQRVRRRVLDLVEDRQAPRRPASARARRAPQGSRRRRRTRRPASRCRSRTAARRPRPDGARERTGRGSASAADPASACRRRTDRAGSGIAQPARRASRSAISRFVATIR